MLGNCIEAAPQPREKRIISREMRAKCRRVRIVPVPAGFAVAQKSARAASHDLLLLATTG